MDPNLCVCVYIYMYLHVCVYIYKKYISRVFIVVGLVSLILFPLNQSYEFFLSMLSLVYVCQMDIAGEWSQ